MIKRIINGVSARIKLYVSGFASMGPKLVFGNAIGLRYNLYPLIELRKLRKSFPQNNYNISSNDLALSQANQLNEFGYVKIKKPFNFELLKCIKNKYDLLIENDNSSISSPNGFTRFLLKPENAIPEIQDLLANEIKEVLFNYYRCSYRIESVRAWRNYHVPDYDPNTMDAFSNTFHNDDLPVTGLRVFILLCDNVTRKTGAFRFHDKKYSKKIVRSLNYFHRFKLSSESLKMLTNESQLKYFEGNLGDVCICNTQECLHAASIPEKGSFRDILQFEIYPTTGQLLSNKEIFSAVPEDTMIGK